MQNSTDTQITESNIQSGLVVELSNGKNKKYVRFAMAALGSIPWIGSYLSILGAVAGLTAEFEQDKVNGLLKLWIEEHKPKLEELAKTLDEIFSRLNSFGDDVQKRIESQEYLALVRKTFQSWDDADTLDKRQMLKRLIMNAGATSLCADDLVRLFIKWIDEYHEAHFAVIRAIYRSPGITRGEIWDAGHQRRPREDSSEADLFRYLIRDLSTGGVIRQSRETTYDGQFIRTKTAHHNKSSTNTMESAFEDSKPYVLTNLGKEFVHYVLNDAVTRIQH